MMGHVIFVKQLTALAEQARAAEFGRVTFAVILLPDGIAIRGRKKRTGSREYRHGGVVPWGQIEREGMSVLFHHLDTVIDHFKREEAQI